jgi:hypothetical protein
MSTYRRTTNPREFPVELSMLFEKASYAPVRMPADGKYYPTEAYAFGQKMNLARWRTAMLRSADTPKAFASILRTIQFKGPFEDTGGWYFTITPLSDNKTIESVKEVVGETMPADEFWRQFE